MVATIEYREKDIQIYQSIFLQHPDLKGKYHQVVKGEDKPKK